MPATPTWASLSDAQSNAPIASGAMSQRFIVLSSYPRIAVAALWHCQLPSLVECHFLQAADWKRFRGFSDKWARHAGVPRFVGRMIFTFSINILWASHIMLQCRNGAN